MEKILFVGQCKQGSNSLFKVLSQQEGLIKGHDDRAMVRKYSKNQDYLKNWHNIDISKHKYLLDKSIINPDKYDYHVSNWHNHNHKMIHMFRNIYNVLRSQFLVVLAGEESYQYNIPKFGKKWIVDENFSETDVLEIMNYNKQKYTHFYNISNLPKDVFDVNENILFCTFEDFINDTTNQFKKVENFIDTKIIVDSYPRENNTEFEWYAEQTTTYQRNLKLFEKYQDFIYNECVKLEEWEKLSELTKIDLISKYGIK
jgi:hypothetical protein